LCEYSIHRKFIDKEIGNPSKDDVTEKHFRFHVHLSQKQKHVSVSTVRQSVCGNSAKNDRTRKGMDKNARQEHKTLVAHGLEKLFSSCAVVSVSGSGGK
jgi:hypothetical protein